jgi:hypothetical protein
VDARRQTSVSRRIAVAALLVTGFFGGCAGPRLEPITGPPTAEVVVAQAGLRLTILPNSWSGFPTDLSAYFTPIAVRIENQRSEDAQVRYADFVAVDDGHIQYRALPPVEVAQVVTSGPWPWYPYREAFLYPYYPFYPYGYAGPFYPYGWSPRSAQDIFTLALREGRILPGATIQGFLYLQLATVHGTSLTFTWTPPGPDGTSLATLSTQLRIVR